MKVIIPVAGAVYRMNVYTEGRPRSLMPLAGKTILGFVIEQFKNIGLKEFVFIVGHARNQTEAYVNTYYPEIKATFVYQAERLGIAHAIHLTENVIAGAPFVIALGDTICEFDRNTLLNTQDNLVFVQRVDTPSKFGVAVVDEKNEVVQITEKPNVPISNQALVGIYRIQDTEVLFSYLNKAAREGQMSHKNHYSITYALEGMLQEKKRICAIKVDNWLDCGSKEDLLQANAHLLRKNKNNYLVMKEEHLHFHNSIFIAPVGIPKNCIIKNSIIGPFVTIGEETEIENAIISNSIVGVSSKIQYTKCRDSVIGHHTKVRGRENIFDIGDNTYIEI